MESDKEIKREDFDIEIKGNSMVLVMSACRTRNDAATVIDKILKHQEKSKLTESLLIQLENKDSFIRELQRQIKDLEFTIEQKDKTIRIKSKAIECINYEKLDSETTKINLNLFGPIKINLENEGPTLNLNRKIEEELLKKDMKFSLYYYVAVRRQVFTNRAKTKITSKTIRYLAKKQIICDEEHVKLSPYPDILPEYNMIEYNTKNEN